MYKRNLHLCSIEHDEVCFEGPECPVCKVVDELTKKVDEVRALEVRVGKLEEKSRYDIT